MSSHLIALRSTALLRRGVAIAAALPPAAAAPLQRSFASGGRDFVRAGRDFWRRLDEQKLARDLEDIAEASAAYAHGDSATARKAELFDPKVFKRPGRYSLLRGDSASEGAPEPGEPRQGGQGGGAEFRNRRRAKPWLHYESLRGETYPSDAGKGPRWQDLTHSEAQRLQEMCMRKRMLDRKVMWLKSQHLPNPEKQAKQTMRRQKQAEELKKSAGTDGDAPAMYPAPYMDMPPESQFLQRIEDKARREELESRFRSRIREEKLENARIVKANIPDVGGVVEDPIKRHVNRRLLRQRSKIHVNLEEILTRNTCQILYEFMQGVGISIVRVAAKKPRQTQQIHYALTSSHDPAWVQKQLSILAPKLRSQLALKANMGQTPNIRFVPAVEAQEMKRAYLYRFTQKIRDQIPVGGGIGAAVGVG